MITGCVEYVSASFHEVRWVVRARSRRVWASSVSPCLPSRVDVCVGFYDGCEVLLASELAFPCSPPASLVHVTLCEEWVEGGCKAPAPKAAPLPTADQKQE
eukprot:14759335-Alexandrium_andersonii.AAC.1